MTSTSPIMLQTDYLVVGAGVSGMGFVDELLRLTKDLNIIIVDRHSSPSGHWNDAYSFVTLHQPAHFYGVNSKELGRDEKDLASKSEILSYYEAAMRYFLASGRVKYFPQCEYTSDGEFHSLLAPDLKYIVGVRLKIVNATHVGPTVPSTKTPEFEIETGVNFIPINGLSKIQCPWKRYVIIGGGKTGIDAVLYLLSQSVNADDITWVIPNDYWFLVREKLYPSEIASSTKELFHCIMKSKTIEDMYNGGEKIGYFGRLDESIKPTRMKAATVSVDELNRLRSVRQIVRKGRVTRIKSTRIVFEKDAFINIDGDTLNVDCTACGVPRYTPCKIFDGNTITIQEVAQLQIAFSACAIAAYESINPPLDDDTKNDELKPIPHSVSPADFLMGMNRDRTNNEAIFKTLGIRWYYGCRLQPFYHAPYLDFFKILFWFGYNEKTIVESYKRLEKQIEN